MHTLKARYSEVVPFGDPNKHRAPYHYVTDHPKEVLMTPIYWREIDFLQVGDEVTCDSRDYRWRVNLKVTSVDEATKARRMRVMEYNWDDRSEEDIQQELKGLQENSNIDDASPWVNWSVSKRAFVIVTGPDNAPVELSGSGEFKTFEDAEHALSKGEAVKAEKSERKTLTPVKGKAA